MKGRHIYRDNNNSYRAMGFSRLLSVFLVLALFAINATYVYGESETVKTQPGGYYYDEYIYEDMKGISRFLY
jgi:hypothetical protein